jgi:hypothetical protein
MVGVVMVTGPAVLPAGIFTPIADAPIVLHDFQQAIERSRLRPHPATLRLLAALAEGSRDEARRRATAPVLPTVLPTAVMGPPSGELSAAAAADRLRVNQSRVRQLARAERLIGRKVAGVWWFTAVEVRRYERERDGGAKVHSGAGEGRACDGRA